MPEDKEPTTLRKGYRPPFLIRIFCDFLIETIENKHHNGWKVTMVVEHFRVLYYLGFLSTLIVGIALTKFFVDFDHTHIIMDIFGSTNLCTYLDFPPATYATPFAYSFAIAAGTMYSILSISRFTIAYNEDKISCRAKRLMTTIHIYFMVSVIWFATSLAVQPDRAVPVSMRFHALPYVNMKIAWFSLQYCIVWFGTNVAWKSILFSSVGKKLFFFLGWLHLYLMIAGTGFGCFALLNGIGDMGPSGLVGKGLWYDVHDKPQFVRMMHGLFGSTSPLGDFSLSILIPMIQSMIIKSKSFDRISNTNTVTFYIYHNLFA